MTQTGNALKARPSHLAKVEAAFEGLSGELTFEDHKGRVLQRMQTLNWDTAIIIVNIWQCIQQDFNLTRQENIMKDDEVSNKASAGNQSCSYSH